MATSEGRSRRPRRVAARIREHVTTALRRGVNDPRLAAIVVTGVDVPPDLGTAHVRVRLLADDGDAGARAAALDSLRRAAGRIRRGLGPALGIKRTPSLQFHYDTGLDAQRRVEELLEEIAREE